MFFNSHISTPPSPPPFPLYLTQTMLDECIQNFSEFQYCIDWGAGESCRKILKRMHGFIRQPEITENYEHCVTVPGTLVQDCQVCTVPAPLSRVHPEEKRRLFTRQLQQMIRNCRMFSRNFLLIPFLGLKR